MTKLSKSLVLRLIRYLRVLKKLKTLGIVNVFSNNLGDAIGVTPAVVRKDFSLINLMGNKRGGYNIDSLMAALREILGNREQQEVIVVGCGRIGTALMNYREFDRDGIRVVAGFDADAAKIQRDAAIPVLPMDELPAFVKANDIEVAILAVPEEAASAVFEGLIHAGIRGYLNFTSLDLKCQGHCNRQSCPRSCTVHNVNIGLELENLFYLIRLEELKILSSEELGVQNEL